MNTISNILKIVLACLVLASCGNSTDDRMLARVGSDYLYASSLSGLIPKGMNKTDSVQTVKNFIHNWINQKILIQNALAETNNETDAEIETKVEKYRQDLQLAVFEQKYIAAHLDTVITTEQVVAFYKQNTNVFELRDYVVNVFYMKFDENEKNLDGIEQEIKRTDSPAEAQIVEKKYAAVATNSFLEADTWVFFTDLLREIPMQIEDKGRFLENSPFFKASHEGSIYFVRIFGYKLKNDTSPLNMVKNKIKNLILRNRAKQLIANLRENIIKKYNTTNDVENYTE